MDWRAWENTVGETRESRDSSESESQGRGEGQRSEVRGLGKEPRGGGLCTCFTPRLSWEVIQYWHWPSGLLRCWDKFICTLVEYCRDSGQVPKMPTHEALVGMPTM